MNQPIFQNILLFIYFCLITKIKSFLKFKYPYSFILSNKNIFIIHQSGITICNEYLTEEIDNVIIFTEEEDKITEQSLSKITHTFQWGYIICIINDKIHIFNEYGISLFVGDKIIPNGKYSDYYTLIPISFDYNSYKYIVGFIYNNFIYFYYYEYRLSPSINIEIQKFESYSYSKTKYSINNKALTCKYLNHYTEGFVLVCFYTLYSSSYDKYLIIFDYFVVESNQIKSNYYPKDEFEFYNIKCLKSILTSDNSKAFIVMYSSIGELRFFIFDINFVYKVLESFYYSDFKCKDLYYGLKISYYKEKEEYIISCLEETSGQIIFEICNSTYQDYEELIKFSNCQTYGYSTLYLSSLKKYFVLSDATCANKDYEFIYLFEENILEEELYEENNLEEELDKENILYEENILEEEEELGEENLIKEEELYEENILEEKELYEENILKEEELDEENLIKEEENNLEEKIKHMKENEEEYYLDDEMNCEQLEKCSICNDKSVKENLCIECNKKINYFLIKTTIKNDDNFIDCANNETKPSNFYFNKEFLFQ